jgi:hypothetical protein
MPFTITLTFGDCGENHKGMQMIGNKVEKGEGYNLKNLNNIRKRFQKLGCEVELYCLNDELDKVNEEINKAYVLVIRNAIQKVWNLYPELVEEQKNLNYDTKAFMYGRVVNKNARYNLCFDDESQEPNYEEGKGRIIAFKSMKILDKIRSSFAILFGKKFKNMKCESNYYYDITKTGIGYHGDTERRKVIAIRLGESLPIYFCWYLYNEKVNKRIEINLNGGDIYVMSEKAVGTDWKERNVYTLRHATGCDKYVN